MQFLTKFENPLRLQRQKKLLLRYFGLGVIFRLCLLSTSCLFVCVVSVPRWCRYRCWRLIWCRLLWLCVQCVRVYLCLLMVCNFECFRKKTLELLRACLFSELFRGEIPRSFHFRYLFRKRTNHFPKLVFTRGRGDSFVTRKDEGLGAVFANLGISAEFGWGKVLLFFRSAVETCVFFVENLFCFP